VYPRREGIYVVIDYKVESQAVQQLSVIIVVNKERERRIDKISIASAYVPSFGVGSLA
jgi:hypothetical protein